jgi:thioesterase domain-containing protein
MGRRLRQAGEAVPLMVLLDTRADQSAAARFDERRLIAYFAGELRVPVSQEDLAGDDADALLRQVIDLGRELGRIPREFGLDEARRRLRVMRATLSAAASFRPTQPFDGRTLLLRAEDELADDPALGWGGLAAGGLEVVPVPGDHRSMLTSPHVETLARHLAAALDEAADGPAEAVG